MPDSPDAVQRTAPAGRARRGWLLALAILVAPVVVGVIVHAPPVRRFVLRYAVGEAQHRFGIRLDAARLDYNLLSLSVGLADIRIVADRPGAVPLFEAEYVRVALPRRVLAGVLAFDEITISNGRIHVVRDPDGRTNLPESPGSSDTRPAALDIARLRAQRLSVDIQDAPNDLRIAVPAIDVDLGRSTGRMALAQPATAAVGAHATRVTRFGGGAAFDGRALALSAFDVQAVEGTTRLQGTVSLLVATPSVDMRGTGTADVERLARWATDADVPRGSATFDAHVSGPLTDPVVDLQLASPGLAWRDTRFSNLTATSRIAAEAADVTDLRLTLAGGVLLGRGRLPFDGSVARVEASWRDVDAGAVTTQLAGRLSTLPDGHFSGEAEASGPLARLEAWNATARVRLEGGATRRGRLAVPGETRVEARDGRWTVEARHRLGGIAPVSLVGDGRLDVQTPSRSTLGGTLTLADTNARDLLGVLRAMGTIPGSDEVVSAGVLSAEARLSGHLGEPEVAAQVRATDLQAQEWRAARVDATVSGLPVARRMTFLLDAPAATVADQPVEDVHASGGVAGDLLTIESLSFAQPDDRGRLQATGEYDLGNERYVAMLDVSAWHLDKPAGQPFEGRVDARFQGSGRLDDPGGSGTVRIAAASWEGTALGDVAGDVRIAGGTATVEVRAPDFNADLTSRIGVRAPFQTVADLRVNGLDLGRLPARGPVAIAGRATLAAHAEGAIDAWRDASVSLEMASMEATAGDLPVRLAEPARLRYQAARVNVDRLELDAGATRFSVSGDLPLSPGPGAIAIAASGDIGDVARAVAATGLATVPVTQASGPVSLQARVTGSVERPSVSGDLVLGPGTATIEGLSTASDLRMRAHLENEVVNLLEAHLMYEGATVDAAGSAPVSRFSSMPTPSAAPMSIRATATNLGPAVLRGAVDSAVLEGVSGAIDLTLNLQTSSRDLTQAAGELALTRLDLRVAGLSVAQRSPTRVVARDGFARIESWNWAGDGATLRVAGQVRLADRQAAVLADGDVDLRVLTPFLGGAGLSTAGHLSPRLSVTGPIQSPRVDGDLVLDGGEVRLVDPRIVLNGLSGRAILTRTTATLTTLTGSANGGTFTGSGTVDYEPGGRIAGHLAADVQDMALEFPTGLRSELNATLAVDVESGPAAEPASGRISGTVTVLRGEYRQPLAVVGGVLAALQARRQTVAATIPGLLDRLALDVHVQTDDDLSVANNYARVELGAALDIVGTAAVPGVSGRIAMREDGQLFVGRNVYTVKPDRPSTIDFVNPATIAPELSAHLATRVGSEDIDVDLTGPADAPLVAMSSSSGLGQADITALLLTGRTLDDLNSADASFIGTQVIGNLSGDVLGFAGRAVGLDTLRLGGVEDTGASSDPGEVATVVDPTSRLTFSKNLRPDVSVTYSQSLRDAAAQTWIVEYLPVRRAEVRVVSGDSNLRTYGFRHDVSFGGRPAGATPLLAAPRRRPARVTDVSVTGQLAFPEARIRSLLKLRVGDRFDFGRWQDDRDRIEDFYRQNGRLAMHVTASRASAADAVRLSYVVDAGPRTAIAVSGADLGSATPQRLSDAWAASIFDDLLTGEATAIAEAALAQQGYVQSKVTARVVVDGETKTLQIAVDPGVQTRATRIRLEGPEGTLRDALSARIEARRLTESAFRDPGAVETDLLGYLRGQGYQRATVDVRPPTVEDGIAIVPIVVTSDAAFEIGLIAFEGREGPSIDDVMKAVGLDPTMPYDPATLDAARNRLLALYRTRGYVATTVAVRAVPRPAEPRIDLTFTIDEGPWQTVGEVVVTGNAGVGSDVVIRAARIDPETVLTPASLVSARTNVYNTGLFRRVDVSAEAVNGRATGPAQPMRVSINVDAWPALRVRYGFQAVEERPADDPTGRRLAPGVVADVTRRTLFGRAIGVGGSVQFQHRQRLARTVVTAPTMFSLPVRSSLVLERVRQESAVSTFVTDTNRVAWEQRLRTARRLTFSYAYRFDRDRTFDTAPNTSSEFVHDVRTTVGRFVGATAWDTRDDPFDAQRGSIFSSGLEWAAERLGSDFRFLKFSGQAARFGNIAGTVLAVSARVGIAHPLGQQELQPPERFYVGGSRTVRGVSDNGLGDRNIFGEPKGGAGSLVLNGEARLPLRPLQKWLRGVVFIDAGNVFPKASDVSLGDLTGSVGFGVRLSTPFGLLRGDYGKVVWGSASVSRTGRWSFGLGQAF